MGTDTKVAAAIKLLRKQGYDIRKTKKKNISGLYFRLSFLFGMYSKFVKKPVTKRKIILAVARSKMLDEVLDEFIKDKDKRKAFDDATDKSWTLAHYAKDIETNGQYKRYKLVERHIGRFWNSETTRIIFDDNYSIQDYINRNKK